ncbi:hypothetical protein PR048_001806 [Dryococelus australis]|uniref:Uncharacterized protein n=1 Tax=Dryococelus australis TaxID=614101 RepID=A0ABQ9IIC3_9NEOP|nr:hypothetical protein PR048_001806 [Dryococelus australis]
MSILCPNVWGKIMMYLLCAKNVDFDYAARNALHKKLCEKMIEYSQLQYPLKDGILCLIPTVVTRPAV